LNPAPVGAGFLFSGIGPAMGRFLMTGCCLAVQMGRFRVWQRQAQVNPNRLKCRRGQPLPPASFNFFYPEKIIAAKFLYLLNSITFAFPKFWG